MAEKTLQEVRPTSTNVVFSIQVGSKVQTAYGPGIITDIRLQIESDTNKAYLVPPVVELELLKPYKDHYTLVLPLQDIRDLNNNKVFWKVTKVLWPLQVGNKPTTFLRNEEKMSIIDEIKNFKKADAKQVCKRCGKELQEGEEVLCSECKQEVQGLDQWGGFSDPQGTQWYTKVTWRQPSVGPSPMINGSKILKKLKIASGFDSSLKSFRTFSEQEIEKNLDLAKMSGLDALEVIRERYPHLQAMDQLKLHREIRNLSGKGAGIR